MTLLDAPEFDYVRDRRRRKTLISAGTALFVFLIGFWLAAGHPVDYPWYWNNHLQGRIKVNAFFKAVEKNDMPKAYGVWMNDKAWQQHQAQYKACPFECFLQTHAPAVQQAELYEAYGVWVRDRDWQQHQEQYKACFLECFLRDHASEAQPYVVLRTELYRAYGDWLNDRDWMQRQARFAGYTFDRFLKDWSPDSPDSDYGAIHSHRIAAAIMHGNVLQVGIFVNERKSKAINLDYDPKDHSLNFSPEDVQFLEGAGGIS